MYRNVLVGGLTAAAILGAGGTALALTGSDGSSGSGQPVSSVAQLAGGKAGAGRGRLLKRLVHAQIVTRKGNTFVNHDLIKGTVTEVSSTSITVQAADKTSETFVVNGDTKVRVRKAGHGAAGAIGDVAKGDQAFVAGTCTSTLTAKHVVDLKK